MAEPLLRSFASTADLVAHLEKEQREAVAATQPWQRDLAPGDRIAYAFRYEGGEEITIYFELLMPDGPKLKSSRMWGKGYSAMCPEGELGSMWRCNALVIINPITWEAARHQGWPKIDFTQSGYERL